MSDSYRTWWIPFGSFMTIAVRLGPALYETLRSGTTLTFVGSVPAHGPIPQTISTKDIMLDGNTLETHMWQDQPITFTITTSKADVLYLHIQDPDYSNVSVLTYWPTLDGI